MNHGRLGCGWVETVVVLGNGWAKFLVGWEWGMMTVSYIKNAELGVFV